MNLQSVAFILEEQLHQALEAAASGSHWCYQMGPAPCLGPSYPGPVTPARHLEAEAHQQVEDQEKGGHPLATSSNLSMLMRVILSTRV